MSISGSGVVISHEIYAGTSYSDEDLAAMARERGPSSEDAVAALLRRYERTIYRACVSYLRNADLAEDASQGVLLRIYRGINRFQGRSSFRTWVYRIVRNECYSVASHHARHRVCESIDETVVLNHTVDMLDFTKQVETSNDVQIALRRLTSKDREIIKLRFFQDLSIKTIAVQLDTSLSGAKMRLYRAIARFEKAYMLLEVDESLSAAT